MRELIPERVYLFEVNHIKFEGGNKANIYILKKERVIIDTGYRSNTTYKKLLTDLKKEGIEKIEYIILTHIHYDHTGLLNYFSDEIPIIAHSYIRNYKNFNILKFIENTTFDIVVTSYEKRIIANNLKKIIDNDWMANKKIYFPHNIKIENMSFIEMSGHSSADLIIILEDLNVAFTGDLVLNGIRFNNIIDLDFENETLNLDLKNEYLRNIKLIEKMGFNKIFPGHMSEITNISGKILKFQKNENLVVKKIKKFLENNNSNKLSELSEYTYPYFGNFNKFLQVTDVLLTLELLKE